MNAEDAFPGKYLRASDLQGKRIRVTIEAVTLDKVGDNRRLVLRFVGKERGMVVNKTNMNTLALLTRSKETDDWVGWRITLFQGWAQFQGNNVAALRISDDPQSAVGPLRERRASGHERRNDQREEFDSRRDEQRRDERREEPRRTDREDRRDDRDFNPREAFTPPPRETQPLITDDDVPFMWLLPLVLPFVGSLSMFGQG
jgi:hypothetical protein